jgi:hypothetical protein
MMKFAIGLLAVFLSCYALGCDPELSESIDNVVTTAPAVCENFCNKRFKCEWYAEGDLKEDAEEDGKERCTVNCAWQMNNGAYVVKDVQEEGLQYRKYKDHVSGSNLRDYFECLWDKDLFVCMESDGIGQDYYTLDISTEEACDQLRKCTKELENDDIAKWEWLGAACGTTEPDPSYLLFYL